MLLVSGDRAYSPADYSPPRRKDNAKPTPVEIQPVVTAASNMIISSSRLVLFDLPQQLSFYSDSPILWII